MRAVATVAPNCSGREARTGVALSATRLPAAVEFSEFSLRRTLSPPYSSLMRNNVRLARLDQAIECHSIPSGVLVVNRAQISRPDISMKRAKELGLEVTALEDNQALREAFQSSRYLALL